MIFAIVSMAAIGLAGLTTAAPAPTQEAKLTADEPGFFLILNHEYRLAEHRVLAWIDERLAAWRKESVH